MEGVHQVFWRRVCGLTAVLCLCTALDSHPVGASPNVSKQRDGALLIAGRSLRCGNARNVLDPYLPNLGLAAPGVVVFNPRLLNRWPASVRLFVFHHECGHHQVGASELEADCWAVKEGVRQGWLDRSGLSQVCRSFGNGPATSTHPSGARRCASLDRCFASATAAAAKQQAAAATAEAPEATPHAAPKLISGPTLKRSGMQPN